MDKTFVILQTGMFATLFYCIILIMNILVVQRVLPFPALCYSRYLPTAANEPEESHIFYWKVWNYI